MPVNNTSYTECRYCLRPMILTVDFKSRGSAEGTCFIDNLLLT